MRLDGHDWNHKRLWRVYCHALELAAADEEAAPGAAGNRSWSSRPNEVWALDFMSDTLYGGRRFRTFNILDEGVREGLAIEIDTSLPAERVVRISSNWRAGAACLRRFDWTMGPN